MLKNPEKWYQSALSESSIQDSINNYLADHPYINGYTPSEQDPLVHELLKKLDINFTNHPHLERWYNHLETFTDAEKAAFPRLTSECQRDEVCLIYNCELIY